jgi:hypothetical protein
MNKTSNPQPFRKAKKVGMQPQPPHQERNPMMKTVLRALFSRRKFTVLAVATALTLGTASAALAGSGVGGVFNLGKTNTVNAITTLVGSVTGPSLRLDNNSTNSAATALDLQVEPGKTPMKVNSTTKVANLNADRLDDKSAEDLSRVAVMNTGDTTAIPTDFSEVTYGQQLSITAPAAGFVRVNGNVTVRNVGCTSGCAFNAYVRHINTGFYSIPQQEDALNDFGNAGLDAVFPVSAGVNTFDIRLQRATGSGGELDGWWGVLTAEYTPYGSTGTGTLSASGLDAASEGPIDKELPNR